MKQYTKAKALLKSLKTILDYRVDIGKIKYPLSEVLFMVIFALLKGNTKFKEIFGWMVYNKNNPILKEIFEKDEIEIIEKIYPTVKKYLPEVAIDEIENNGFWEYKGEMYMTRSINNRDCVFVYYENDVAKCAIEKAFINGEIDFKKPVSCHLFPIRLADFGGPILKYESYNECKPAVKKGKKENITVAEFLKEPLIRKFGNEFYEELIKLGE